MTTPSFRSTLRLLTSRRFGIFLVASLLSNIGAWAQQVAEPWLLLSMGGSAWMVGLDGFALNAPVWGLTLLGGLLADRRDRRLVILVFQSIQMMCPLMLMILVGTHQVRPWEVIVLSAGVGITDALSMPAFSSIVPSIVEPEQLGSAFALNSTQFNLSRLLGPALAGALLASFGAQACFGVNTLSYVPFIAVALWILPKREWESPPVPGGGPSQMFSDLLKVLRDPRLSGGLATVAITSIFCGPLITFCPILIKEVFQKGAAEFGGALSAFGLGGIVGSVSLLAIESKQVDRQWLGSGFAVLHALTVWVVARNTSLVALVGFLVVAGMTMTMSNTALNTQLQSQAEDAIRGQTASLYMLAMRGGLALGNLLSGVVVGGLGIRNTLAANALMAVGLQLVVLRVWRRENPTASGSRPGNAQPGGDS